MKIKLSRIFIRLLILFAMSTLSACLSRPAIDSELHGQIHWQGEVRLQGNVILAENSVLTIAPGTRVVFLPLKTAEKELFEHPYFPGSELIVRGQLIARGTTDAPIQFQFVDPAAGPGSWGGINIEDSERVVFDYCSFRQADSAIHARRSMVAVENSLFTENLVGIRFHDTDILIEKNLLHNNGTAIRFHFGAPMIYRNVISGNRKGLFITSEPREYAIENNSFLDNSPYQVSLGEGVQETVTLKNNYWGRLSSDQLLPRLYDGRLDSWLGVVDFLPMRSEPDPETGIRWNR